MRRGDGKDKHRYDMCEPTWEEETEEIPSPGPSMKQTVGDC